ncbi:MAG: response regulator [Herbinix sp.]|nr:response regulator [Herbinix sp.]
MYKVMIVDDMEIFRRYIKRLKVWGDNSGFIIDEEAVDGLDALNKLEKNPVDLVIADIKMPQMDGIELLSVITEKKLCPYVVLLSDYTEFGYARQGIVYGAFDYIGKPVGDKELTELFERIKKHLLEKQQQEHKQAELQESINDAFFTATDVQMIIQMICRGEIKATTLISDMIDTIEKTRNNDRSKTLLIIKNTLHEIIHETLKCHPWIVSYYQVNLLQNISFTCSREWEEMKSAFIEIVGNLISIINQFISCQDNTMVKETSEYILTNLNEKLSVKVLSEKMFISKAHLSEIFKQKTGKTVLQYITMVKMERAKRLMEEDLRNYEIAYQLGYSDNEYFNKVFKNYTGLSLTQYRQRSNNNRR